MNILNNVECSLLLYVCTFYGIPLLNVRMILFFKVDCSSYITNSGSIAIEGGSTGRISHCPREHEYLCGPDHRTYPGPCNLCRSMDRLSKLGRYHIQLNLNPFRNMLKAFSYCNI